VAGQTIPQREPIGDAFSGIVIEVEGKQALAVRSLPDGEIIASGDFVIRYGLRYLGKLHFSIVPGLVALDYGDFLTGEDAWNFLMNRSNLYPRSEVVGYRNDGQDEMIVIKSLDLGVPPEVLVYTDASATTPIAKPVALIAPLDMEIPARLLEFLPRFASVPEWQAVL
jgi:hypothetical protein